ncbi:MAG: NUDIX hydrolase [Nitratireductor sp.]|nr:NUDIX hydrolase [Nitratireductor sp.]
MTTESSGTGEKPVEPEIARIETLINSPQMRDMRRHGSLQPGIRPRNAASLVIVDGAPGSYRILMGKRNQKLKFMPGALVFPGGSVDRSDGSVPAADCMNPVTEERIVAGLRGKPSRRAARALGMAAVRELAEESGLIIGTRAAVEMNHKGWEDFARAGLAPSLGGLSLLARAITPPGPPRRFDTWFFVTHSASIGHQPEGGFDPSGELENLQWISPENAINGDTREITRVMLVELMNRLKKDPGLDPAFPAPFYFARQKRFQKTFI